MNEEEEETYQPYANSSSTTGHERRRHIIYSCSEVLQFYLSSQPESLNHRAIKYWAGANFIARILEGVEVWEVIPW